MNISFIYLPSSLLSWHPDTHTDTHAHAHTHTQTRDLWQVVVHTFDISLLYFDMFLLSILHFFVRLQRKRVPSSSRCLHTKPERDGNLLTFIMYGVHIYHCLSFEESSMLPT
jgi:hypothetical protein